MNKTWVSLEKEEVATLRLLHPHQPPHLDRPHRQLLPHRTAVTGDSPAVAVEALEVEKKYTTFLKLTTATTIIITIITIMIEGFMAAMKKMMIKIHLVLIMKITVKPLPPVLSLHPVRRSLLCLEPIWMGECPKVLSREGVPTSLIELYLYGDLRLHKPKSGSCRPADISVLLFIRQSNNLGGRGGFGCGRWQNDRGPGLLPHP